MEYDAEIRQVRLDYEQALDEVLSRQSDFYDRLRRNLGARLEKRDNLTWNEIQVCLESRMVELEYLRENRPISAYELSLARIKQIIAEALNEPRIDWEEIKDHILKLVKSSQCSESARLALTNIIRPKPIDHSTETLSWNTILDVVTMLKESQKSLLAERESLRKKVVELDSRQLTPLSNHVLAAEACRKSISEIINDDGQLLSWADIVSRVQFFVNEIEIMKKDVDLDLAAEAHRKILSSIVYPDITNTTDWTSIVFRVKHYKEQCDKLTREQALVLKTNDDLNALLKTATLEKDIAIQRADDLQTLNESLNEDNKRLREKISGMQDTAREATHLLCKNSFVEGKS